MDLRRIPGRQGRLLFLGALTLVVAVIVFVLPPLRQAQSYHRFADSRGCWGFPNFLNVASNAPFLLAGLAGLWVLRERSGASAPTAGGPHDAREAAAAGLSPAERISYGVFFLGVALVGFGSGYYHWAPCDATLVWDRLPMTLAFMAFLAASISERVDSRLGLWLLGPLLLAGAGSVFYWQQTGNLLPYGAVQYYSIILIALLVALFPPRFTRTRDIVWVLVIYGASKVAEALDKEVFNLTGLVSGHTLKHIVAALACYWVFRMLWTRSRNNKKVNAAI